MSTTNTKLITLDHFKTGLQASKTYIDAADATLSGRIDAVVTDIEGIVATGGEANILEGMKVNGVALPITNKLVDLIIETGSETGALNVNGVDVFVKGLGALAALNEISEDELSDALKASIAAKATNADLSALEIRVTTAEGKITTIEGDVDALETAVKALQDAGYQTAEQVETIAKAAVAASGHASFKEAESDPTAEGFVAEDNVMYLWPADDGDGYSIYGKVGDEMKLFGHTKVDLSAYSTTEQMNAAIAAGIADKAALADLNAAVERIVALEEALANYYTKDEAEAKFMDESEVDTKLESYDTSAEVDAKIEAAKPTQAADEEVAAMNTEVFGG